MSWHLDHIREPAPTSTLDERSLLGYSPFVGASGIMSMNAKNDVSVIADLQRALAERHDAFAQAALELLADTGLAHHHIRLMGTGALARLPIRPPATAVPPRAGMRHG
jgi:hypothetical protein